MAGIRQAETCPAPPLPRATSQAAAHSGFLVDASPEGEGRGQQRRWRPAGRQELGLARQTAFSPLPAVGPGLELPTTSAAGDSRVHRVLVSGSESTCPCRQRDCTSGVRVTSLWKRLARGVPAVSGTWRPPGRWQVGLVGFNSCGCQGPGGQSRWPGLDRGSEGEGTQLGLRVGGVGEPDPVGCEEKPCNGCGPGARGAGRMLHRPIGGRMGRMGRMGTAGAPGLGRPWSELFGVRTCGGPYR